eukprot:2254714-Ditylum_brightwellii.AAC.1
MGRKKQNAYGKCQDHGLPNVIKSRSWLYDSAKSNDGKEVDYIGVNDHVNNYFDGFVDGNVDESVDVDVEDGVDGGVNGGVTHLTHLTRK